MIRIEHLLSFSVVAQEGNVTKAAEKLFRTQPAISAQLKQLNEAFGEPLYFKHLDGIKLTEAGEGLLAHARAVVRAYEGAKRYAKNYQNLEAGNLKLVASLTIGVYLLPELLAQFERLFPQLMIQLNTRYSQLSLQTLLHGQAELAFVELPVEKLSDLSSDFVCKEFHRDEILLVASPNHPLSNKTETIRRSIHKYKIVWAEAGSGTRVAVEKMLEEANIKLEKEIEVTGIEAIKRAVLNNLGIAFLSRLAVKKELASGELISLDFAKLPLFRPFSLIHPRWDLCSNSAKAFLEFFESLESFQSYA